mgnify:FL=1
MKLQELMTPNPIWISPETPVSTAARILAKYNIGMLPVCTSQGRLRGLLTDRDIVTRCLAADRDPSRARAETVMTRRIVAGSPAMDAAVAAHLMGREQVRRLPVLENGVLCGVVSLADLARREETEIDASDALGDISGNLSRR